MKTNDQINRFIHEAMGKCWHNMRVWIAWSGYPAGYYCPNCKKRNSEEQYFYNPTYLEYGKPWGDMLRWAMKQPWWRDFEYKNLMIDTAKGEIINIDIFANPRSLAEHIAEYLEGLKDG